ncbi:MAG: hypothetical protein NTW16_06200, partial [Bacteroidetes bacterium]|nr:hypothetical protein [Bacteroidota bacterium]
HLLEIAPHAQVVGSGNAIRYLKDLLGFDFPHLIVKDGQTLSLGNKTLQFVAAANLHWPDSMMTYLQEDKLLFTCDIFGEHYCNEGVFDDVVGDFDDAFRYYYDVIMKPYSKFMLQAIERIRPLNIAAVLPGHGAILRKNWKKYVDLSEQYAQDALNGQKLNRIFLGYVSAYQNTGIIAGLISRGIQEAGDFEVDLCDIEKMEPAEIEQKISLASAIILGCPTFSQNILMPVYQVFAMINPIRDRNKLAAAFGSYGWSGEGAKIITSALSNLKLRVIDGGLMIKFTPHTLVEEKFPREIDNKYVFPPFCVYKIFGHLVKINRYSFFFGAIVIAGLAGLQSCLPERKVAEAFIQSPHAISLLVTPPGLVFKNSLKAEFIEGFDSLSQQQQDSALWDHSKYVQFINDSILLENYMNNFIEELRFLGFNVYLNSSIDSFTVGKPQSYILDVVQLQLDEYFYMLKDEDAFLDTIYYKKFNLNAVDYSCWFDLSKAGTENARKTLLYTSNTAYDTFDGRFFNDPFTGTVRYKYTIDSLQTKDVYDMATYLGKKHAGYIYDFFMNQYIAKHLPEGIRMEDYYHYDPKRKSFSPANEDRLEILETK